MSLLRRIEKSMDRRLGALFSAGREKPGAREGIELYRDALEQIASRSSVGRNGIRVFAFNTITVELRADTPDRKAVLETLFDPAHMVDDIRATLEEEKIEPPEKLTVMIHYPEGAADLKILCEKTEQPEPVPAAVLVRELRPAMLTMLEGAVQGGEFALNRSPVNVGRERDVIDSMGRLVRRNELYFPEGEHEANGTVSRSHAHIAFDTSTGHWRIYDDGSSLGTSLFRDGKRIEVPPHAVRGVALREGDEIYLGQVKLRFG